MIDPERLPQSSAEANRHFPAGELLEWFASQRAITERYREELVRISVDPSAGTDPDVMMMYGRLSARDELLTSFAGLMESITRGRD